MNNFAFEMHVTEKGRRAIKRQRDQEDRKNQDQEDDRMCSKRNRR